MSTSATAPGKIILFGEHAVVYGHPALAVPIPQLHATATIRSGKLGSGVIINAVDLGIESTLRESPSNPLALTADLVLHHLDVSEPDVVITLHSTVPISSGLGSGAAVSAALARAFALFLKHPLDNAALSALVYEVERMHHGTPSGIDNTVICYNKPVYFVRGKTIEVFDSPVPFHILIADTGIPSPTKFTVASVRAGWESNKAQFEESFMQIGCIVNKARSAIESGKIGVLGPFMNENQTLLQRIGVSSEQLDTLVETARQAGATGAKLSGGGGGGNMIALVDPVDTATITDALQAAGAVRVIHAIIGR
jgi:mevalonate kinase